MNMKIFLIGIIGVLISVTFVKTEESSMGAVEEALKNKHKRKHRSSSSSGSDDDHDLGYYEQRYFDEYFQRGGYGYGYGFDGDSERKGSRHHRSRKDRKKQSESRKPSESKKPSESSKKRSESSKKHGEIKKHRVNNDYEEPPIYNENTYGLSVHKTCKHSGMVALTFDDGVVPETSQILDVLSQNGVSATFFVLGSTVDQYPSYRSVLNRILNEGHTLGSHTYSHADLTGLDSDGIKYELNQAGNVFENACGERPKFMRPPYGSVNDQVASVSSRLGYEIVHWNLDTNDWRTPYDTTPIIDSLYQHDDGTHSSKIVLMHDKPITVQALDSIINFYKKKGYSFVNMEKCLGMKGYF